MSPETNAFSMPQPLPLEQASEASPVQEREVADLEVRSERTWSKEHMTEERARLAAEIAEERYAGRHKIVELRMQVHMLQERLEQSGYKSESIQIELESLESRRAERANSLTGKVRSFLHIETSLDAEFTKDVQVKSESLDALREEMAVIATEIEASAQKLIETDNSLVSLREKIARHYVEAGEYMHRTVEQIMLRNNVFIVHTINEHIELRHNDNSNVSKNISFEDDLDILLSLEPSISASSVSPGVDEEGRVSGLWSHSGGVLIRGGRVVAASMHDMGTRSLGIKERHAPGQLEISAEDIDVVVGSARSSLPGDIGGYNELVIDNPEVSGYFKPGSRDEQGTYWIYDLSTRQSLEHLHELYKQDPRGDTYKEELELFQRNLDNYRNRFQQIHDKGLLFYVMTPDRRFFEVSAVHENGTLTVGSELTPEQAAKGRAGLSPEKRKDLGTQLLQREIFRTKESHAEAMGIISQL